MQQVDTRVQALDPLLGEEADVAPSVGEVARVAHELVHLERERVVCRKVLDVEVAVLGARLAQTAALGKCERPRGTVRLPCRAKRAEEERKFARERCVRGRNNGADFFACRRYFAQWFPTKACEW